VAVKKCLVSGSSELIGGEVVAFFSAKGWEVHGIDIICAGISSELWETQVGIENVSKTRFLVFAITN
jgi:uncharacterized protein YsxB (DUF464 family)